MEPEEVVDPEDIASRSGEPKKGAPTDEAPRTEGRDAPAETREPGLGRSRVHAYGLFVLVLVLVLSPLVTRRDDFPLSNYPMFSSRRPAVTWVARALAVDQTGATYALSPSLVASGEPMQAVATLRKTLARGPGPAAILCREIAGRVGALSDSPLERATFIQLDQVEVSVLGWFSKEAEPKRQVIRATCPIDRGALP